MFLENLKCGCYRRWKVPFRSQLPAIRKSQSGLCNGSCFSHRFTNVQKIKDIPLATGSNALRGIAISPDGNFVFVTHNLGRFQIPTSQLQQGWMNTSAMSIININDLSYGGSVLLDEADRGAAGIWDVVCTAEQILISHSGTHEISVIDYPAFLPSTNRLPTKTLYRMTLNSW